MVDTGVAKSFTLRRRDKWAGILFPKTRTTILLPCCFTSTGVLLPFKSMTTWPSPSEPRWKPIFEMPCSERAAATGVASAGFAELIFRIKVLPSTRVVNAPASAKFTVKRERCASEVTSTVLASAVATAILPCFKLCCALSKSKTKRDGCSN